MSDASRRADADAALDPVADVGRASRAQDYVARRKMGLARTVSDVADAVRVGGDTLGDHPRIKAAFDRAALEMGGLAEGIARRDLGEMVSEAEAVVRRRPVIAAAAAITAGLALFFVARRPGRSPPTSPSPEAPTDCAAPAGT